MSVHIVENMYIFRRPVLKLSETYVFFFLPLPVF